MEQQLSTFNYCQKWLDYGLLTKEQLHAQLEEYNKGEDIHTEHYRYRRFQTWLQSKSELTDLDIEHFIELAIADPDQTMAGSAMALLFRHEALTDLQTDEIAPQFAKFGDWAVKIIQRTALHKRLSVTRAIRMSTLESRESKLK